MANPVFALLTGILASQTHPNLASPPLSQLMTEHKLVRARQSLARTVPPATPSGS